MSDNKPEDAAKELQAALADAKLPADLKANSLLLVSMRQREKARTMPRPPRSLSWKRRSRSTACAMST